MNTSYDADVIAWAEEQARLLRAGLWTLIDIEHIAEEIEDVARNEKHRLLHRLAVLWAHLLKWQFQQERRGSSWRLTIQEQRRAIRREITATPSLKVLLEDVDWIDGAWSDALVLAAAETGLGEFPRERLWSTAQTLDAQFWPE